MTELEHTLAETLTIRPEDHALYIRALWKSHRDLEEKFFELFKYFEVLKENSEITNKAIQQLSKDVSDIKQIFLVSSHMSKFIKYTAFYIAPILTAIAGLYVLFHKSIGQ